jgi:uncharacterized repeat protein (TIGR03806 family)
MDCRRWGVGTIVALLAWAGALACASDAGFATSERSLAVSEGAASAACANANVVSPIDCAAWMVDTPFRNDFDGSLPGVPDANGTPTGFSAVLATRGGGGSPSERLELRPDAGQLAITTTAGIAAFGENSQDNALGVALDLPNGVFRVSTTLVSPATGSGAYEQAGLWFGLDQRDTFKLVLMSAPDRLVVQALLEEDDVPREPFYLRVGAPPTQVRFSLEIDPLRRQLRALAAIDGGPERLVGTYTDIPASWVGRDRAAGAPFAGIFATHRRRAETLGPLTYVFDDFEVRRRSALPDNPAAVGRRWKAVPAFEPARFSSPTQLLEVPETGQLLVSEREGKIFEMPPGGGSKRLVLDLSRVTQGHQDCGLLGMALHPDFAQQGAPGEGLVYVHYAFADPPRPPPVATSTPTVSRLSRFTVDRRTMVADPASELVLIAQRDEHVYHQGSGMFFHPRDGFLYLSVGDEGGGLCSYDNCQRIDRDLFGGVLRIDVDQRGGDISHPIPRQPESGSTAGYFIPNDNPFVGQGGLEEFYAIGLRSPHRMTYDAEDDIAWIGEVGQNRREELDVLSRAANYQWPLREGHLEREPLEQTPLGAWTDPVLDLTRDESAAVIGGFVYRGSRFPELAGKYIFGDYVYGNIWALEYARDADGSVRVLSRERLIGGLLERTGTIISFGTDSAGELYVMTVGAGPILKLEREQPAAPLPARLSEVGAFDDLVALAPSDQALPYSVQSPLFSDGAQKKRWLQLPPGSSIGFAESGPYAFPEGSVFIKHFDMALDERRPELRRRLETRFLVSTPAGFYGVSYRWNAGGTDATPVLDSTLETLAVTSADGSVRAQPYFYPGPSDCLVCHNAGAGHVLGVRTAQLNGEVVDEATGVASPQLLAWSERGLFDTPLDAEAVDRLPQLASPSDEQRSLDDRVRSYLDANCSMCHGTSAGIRATWDGRYETPLERQHLIDEPLSGDADLPRGAVVVSPGHPELSALWLRDGSVDPALRMPPLGRQTVDRQWLALLERWIRELPSQ